MFFIEEFAGRDWLVLDIDEDKERVLLLSKSSVGCDSYNDNPSSAKWRSSSIRKWLNTEFLEIFFSQEEREAIVSVVLENKDNSETKAVGGTKTKDKVFLLSIEEAEKYFSDEDDDIGPKLFEEQYYSDALEHLVVNEEKYNSLSWWLRSPGIVDFADTYASASFMDEYGCVNTNGQNVISEAEIRPAIWVEYKAQQQEPDYFEDFEDEVEDHHDSSSNCSKEKSIIKTKSRNYEGKKKISFAGLEWNVLGENTVYNRALIITVSAIGHRCYGEGPVTWETSSIRSWLNNEFLNTNFTKSEQEKILSIELDNNDNPMYETKGGNNTSDKVFLLSFDEVNDYYENIQERALGEGWWLRSPGRDGEKVACVYAHGVSAYYGFDCNFELAIRPAMYVDLSVVNSL